MAHEAGSELTAESSLPVGNPDGFALLNDLPVDQLTGDLLGMHAAAEGIAKMLHASAEASPFVVAVDADWAWERAPFSGWSGRNWSCYRPRYLNIQRLNYLWTVWRSSASQDPGELIT